MRDTKTIQIPRIPGVVDLDDLDWTHNPPRLLTQEEFNTLRQYQSELKPQKRISKKDPALFRHLALSTIGKSFGFFSETNTNQNESSSTIGVFYKGARHHKELGAGGSGTVKLLQLESGEWKAVKIQHGNGDSIEQKISSIVMGGFSLGYAQYSRKRNGMAYHQLMDYVPGSTLGRININLKNNTLQMSDVEILNMIHSVLAALVDMHSRGVFQTSCP